MGWYAIRILSVFKGTKVRESVVVMLGPTKSMTSSMLVMFSGSSVSNFVLMILNVRDFILVGKIALVKAIVGLRFLRTWSKRKA